MQSARPAAFGLTSLTSTLEVSSWAEGPTRGTTVVRHNHSVSCGALRSACRRPVAPPRPTALMLASLTIRAGCPFLFPIPYPHPLFWGFCWGLEPSWGDGAHPESFDPAIAERAVMAHPGRMTAVVVAYHNYPCRTGADAEEVARVTGRRAQASRYRGSPVHPRYFCGVRPG